MIILVMILDTGMLSKMFKYIITLNLVGNTMDNADMDSPNYQAKKLFWLDP